MNHEEREYLEWNYNVHKLLNETCKLICEEFIESSTFSVLRDMNAMRASEIYDMMQSDFESVYIEYKKVVASREREAQMAKAKEMEAVSPNSYFCHIFLYLDQKRLCETGGTAQKGFEKCV